MNLQDSFSVLMRRVLQKVFVIVEVMSIDHLMLVTSALCRMPYTILGSLPPQHHKHPISAWSILICLNTSRFESDTSFPRPVWGMRDSMSNETDGFNKILNGLQIAFYLLRFVFDHPSKTVLDSARASTRAANSTKNFKFLSLEKALLAFLKSVVVHLTDGILRA